MDQRSRLETSSVEDPIEDKKLCVLKGLENQDLMRWEEWVYRIFRDLHNSEITQ